MAERGRVNIEDLQIVHSRSAAVGEPCTSPCAVDAAGPAAEVLVAGGLDDPIRLA